MKKQIYVDTLINNYYNFAVRIIRKHCVYINFDVNEDLIAIGLIGLVLAAKTHDKKKLPFKSWASFKIRCEINSFIKNQIRTKKGKEKQKAITIPLSTIYDSCEFENINDYNPEKLFINKNLIDEFLKKIPKRSVDVIILYIKHGYTFLEIGKLKNYSRSNASAIYLKALKTLKESNIKKSLDFKFYKKESKKIYHD